MRKLLEENPPGNDSLLLQRFRELDSWKKSSSLLLYSPIGGEPDPTPLMTEPKDIPCLWLFPRIEGDRLELYRKRPESRWITGSFGIREPDPETWDRASLSDVDMAIVPGLAFDLEGRRLGRGKGFYDRLLGHPEFRGIKIGFAWQWQLLPIVPCEPHDIRMDFVIAGGIIHPEGSVLDKTAKRG